MTMTTASAVSDSHPVEDQLRNKPNPLDSRPASSFSDATSSESSSTSRQPVSSSRDAETLTEFLAAIRLESYEDQPVDLGVGLPMDLVEVDDADFDAMGMKKLEKGRLQVCFAYKI